MLGYSYFKVTCVEKQETSEEEGVTLSFNHSLQAAFPIIKSVCCFLMLRFPPACNSLHNSFVLNCFIAAVLPHWILSAFVFVVSCKDLYDIPVC